MRRLNPQNLRDAILGQSPTGEQRDAIFADELEFLLRACPGSGKTWTTCRRFLWRVANWNYTSGGSAMLSFTNVAVNEFKLATEKIGRGALDEPHYVGTLDSFVERFVLGPFGHLITDGKKRPRLFVAPWPGDLKNGRLTVFVEIGNGRKMPVPAWKIYPKLTDGTLAFFSKPQYQEIPVNEGQARAAIMALMKRGEYSHSLRAYWACDLLTKHPRIAALIAKRFPEIIIDEAQDTGVWFVQVIRELRNAGSKITLVGDPDQCIFEFGQASVGTLDSLRKEWRINEWPLNKSFRCNDTIASAVRQISGNHKFEGRGPVRSELEGAFIYPDATESFRASIQSFKKRVGELGIKPQDCAILCRGHEEAAKIRGVVRYKELQGKTKAMAEAAYLRDAMNDFAGAVKAVINVLREMCIDDPVWAEIDEHPSSETALKVRIAVWKYVRSPDSLPGLHDGATVWITKLRAATGALLNEIGIASVPNMSTQFKHTGVDDPQLPLFGADKILPDFRFDTIHKAKGESIEAVIVVGSKKFYDRLAKDVSARVESEDKRLGYVAMTRAVRLLYIAVPKAHFATFEAFWRDRGFVVLG